MREILKAVVKTSSGTIASLFFGALSIKVLAVVLGPVGVGMFSIVRQIQQLLVSVGTMGGQIALVQGLSSKRKVSRDDYIVTSFWITFACTVLISICLVCFSHDIARLIFGEATTQMIVLVRWLILCLWVSVAYTFFNALLNGYRAIGIMAWGQISIAATSLAVVYKTAQMVKDGQPEVFVWMLSISFLTGFLVVFAKAYLAGWLKPALKRIIVGINVEEAKHFFSIGGTTVVTGLLTTGTLLFVRALIANRMGMYSAGTFDVAWTLSMMYVTLILTSLGTYYLPTLAGMQEKEQRQKFVGQLLYLTTLLFVPLVTIVILFKPLIIHVFYTSEFDYSLKILRWMLIGDYFKVAAYVVAMPVLARADMKVFFVTELLWNGCFLLISFVSIYVLEDLQGIGVVFSILYGLLFAYYGFYAKSRYDIEFNYRMKCHWLLGLLVVVVVSWLTWSDIEMDWVKSVTVMSVVMFFSWFAIEVEDRRKLLDILSNRLPSQD
ncbi:MAG: oligosaccharide flippase family protein [Proteobacteria bacterium]|nr:oligosaccharide flippase family protein [Pseudomonadota bacterium]MBU1715154.1 oligosaccharide flippase family protein [Pseudomonadota bacterium]